MTKDPGKEVPCVDCEADIIAYKGETPRCDTCRDHHDQDCGKDCPVICPGCKEHHFEPYCGAS